MSFDWSKHKGGSGDFVKFENLEDSVVGQIVSIREHTFKPEKGPVVLIDILPKDADEAVTLACDKVDLRIKIGELEPQVSDMLAVKYVATEKTPNGTKKVFAIRHKQGERLPEPAAEPEWDDPDVGEVAFPEPREEFSSDPF